MSLTASVTITPKSGATYSNTVRYGPFLGDSNYELPDGETGRPLIVRYSIECRGALAVSLRAEVWGSGRPHTYEFDITVTDLVDNNSAISEFPN